MDIIYKLVCYNYIHCRLKEAQVILYITTQWQLVLPEVKVFVILLYSYGLKYTPILCDAYVLLLLLGIRLLQERQDGIHAVIAVLINLCIHC